MSASAGEALAKSQERRSGQKDAISGWALFGLSYAPPFSPVWDPVLTAARQVLKQV